ncbi:MAG TPA: hypothetical protein VE978_09135 [Chitinophagales bacterium]|nr:hypothetical protein [Chitinophagales bacterium]
MRSKILHPAFSPLSKIFCTAILWLHASFACAQGSTTIDELLNSLASESPCSLDSPTLLHTGEGSCYLIYQSVHHNWNFIDPDVGDLVLLLDSLEHLHQLREPVAPFIIPIPNAPPMPGENYPHPLEGYGVYATPDIPH